MKPTTIENQVIILSFGSSRFVSFVYSRNRTHDENVAPNWSQNNPAKKKQKIFFTVSKSPIEKNFDGRKHWKSVAKTEREFKRIHLSWKNCEKHAISQNMFPIQTNIPGWPNMKVIHCPFYRAYTCIQKKDNNLAMTFMTSKKTI